MTRKNFLSALVALPFWRSSQKRKLVLELADFTPQKLKSFLGSVNVCDPAIKFKVHYITGVKTLVEEVSLRRLVMYSFDVPYINLNFRSETSLWFDIFVDHHKIDISVFHPSRIMTIPERFYTFVALEIILP